MIASRLTKKLILLVATLFFFSTSSYTAQGEKSSNPEDETETKDEKILHKFEQLVVTDRIVEDFIANIKQGNFELVKKFLKDPLLLKLLTTSSVKEALDTAIEREEKYPSENEKWGDLLMDNLVISLLNGPNAPLIEAFFEGGKAPQELIKKHLSQVLHNYKHLEQKDTFLHLQDAFISEYSQFIAIPLIVQKSIHEKLKHAQICTLFFILVAKNDTKTVETFLKKSELSHLFGGPVFFVNQVLTMPLNESIDLPKEKRIEVMYKLLEHKLFTPFLLTACKTNRQTSKNFQEIALSAAQTQSNDRLTKIACNILCHEDMKEVLEDLQKKADGQFKDFIDLEIAKYKQKK